MTFAARYIGWIKSSLYQIQRSLRLRGAASAHLARTPTANGNRTTWSLSMWVKLGDLSTATGKQLFGVGNSDRVSFSFNAANSLEFECYNGAGADYFMGSSALFRDPSAHMHVLAVWDTNNATAGDRQRLFVNGVRLAAASTGNAIPLGALSNINTTVAHNLGRSPSGLYPFDGYVSDVHFVDGQALTPGSFGQINAITGQWSAKQYVGTYGTNGFYLDFSDNSSLANLCLDRSGNGNHFTANNISLTAGATYDSVLDVPLGGDNVVGRGNYCTMNPLRGAAILTAGNLDVAQNAAAYVGKTGTVGVSTDKWYWEFVVGTVPTVISVGIADEVWATNGLSAGCYFYHYNGGKYIGGSNQAYSGNGYTTGDVLGFALDMVAGTLTCYKNNISQGVLVSGLTGTLFPAITLYGSGGGNYNFGQRPFAYTPPAGFKALHTGNLVSETVAVSGSFTGNASADGFFAWMNGAPETLTINGNAVTFGTHADKTAGGFKLRTSSSSYNASGTNTWTATVLSPSTKSAFKHQNAKGNP